MSTLTCERCGGGLHAEGGSIRLRCPYCGNETGLAPAVLDAARDHRQDVDKQLAKAAYNERARAGWASLGYADRPGSALSGAVAPVGAVQGIACHSCGAPSSFGVGAMLSNCAHCGASLLATAEVQARGLGEAARAARATRLEALRNERSFATALARKKRVIGTLVIAWGVALIAVANVVNALDLVPNPATGEEIVARDACLSVLALVVLGTVHLWRRSWRERAKNVVRAGVLRYAGREVLGVEALTTWMNVYWLDDYRVYDLASAHRSHAAACNVRGYPALIIANLLPAGGQGIPFIDILLSAWYDTRSDLGEGPEARGDDDARCALAKQGFTLSSGPSGIHATIRGDASRRILKAGIDFGAALDTLAHVAASQGGRPQQP